MKKCDLKTIRVQSFVTLLDEKKECLFGGGDEYDESMGINRCGVKVSRVDGC